MEIQLIQRARAGDREAFAALFEQYKNLVYRTAYLMLGDAAEAEDALQDVFLQVHKHLAAFDERKGAFTTWLHRVTVNFCLNHRRKRRPIPLDEASPLLVHPFPAAQLADEEAVMQATSRLSDRQRAVIVLRYYWDLPYAEIASILDVPLGTVKSRLDQALKALRKALEDEFSSRPGPSLEVCE